VARSGILRPRGAKSRWFPALRRDRQP